MKRIQNLTSKLSYNEQIFNETEIEIENCLKEYNVNNCKNTSNDDGPIRNNIF